MSLINQNLLSSALEIIPKQNFKYLKYLGNTINEFGVSVPQYADSVDVQGSVQAVEVSLYSNLDLDMEQNYRMVYAPLDIGGNESQAQPDRFIIQNSVWEVVKNSAWYEFNGWCAVLVVEIKELRK